MILGVDYSAGVPSPAALRRAGVVFVARYIAPGDRRKELTRAEVAAMNAAGIGIVAVYEDTTGDWRSGRLGGRRRAAFVLGELPKLGAPAGASCYFAADSDVPSAELTTAVEYVRGAADMLGAGRTGVYGEHDVVKACLDQRVCRFGWQTPAWSHHQVDPRAQILQQLGQVTIDGITCDRDFAVQAVYGQWDRPGGEDMPLTEAEWVRMTALVERSAERAAELVGAKYYRMLAQIGRAHV